jgi:hypothetical protein
MARMSELLAKCDSMLKARQKDILGRTRYLLEHLPQVHLDSVRSNPPNFNVLEQCGLYSDERQHSAILAWLLDAKESHAQGNKFFIHVAELCKLQVGEDVLDYTVRTEFPGFESIADIVIFRKGDFLIYIENKIFAAEGDKQLDRQERDLLRRSELLQIPKSRRCAVFLTPQGRPPITGNPKKWSSVSYSQVAKTLVQAAGQVSDAKLRFFVEDWLAVLAELS